MPEKPQERMSIDKAVPLTYDSDPRIRLKAAQFLATKVEDPRAIFALIELSGDKDQSVSGFAKQSLGKMEDPSGTISSLEQFFMHKEELAKDETSQKTAKEKLMPSIEKLFSRMDGKKASRLRQKLMPSIEKLFSPRYASPPPVPEHRDPLSGIAKMHHEEEKEEAEFSPPPKHTSQLEEMMREKLPINPSDMELVTKDEPDSETLDEIEKDMPLEQTEEYQKASFILDLKHNIYQRALDLATTPGIDSKSLKDEEKKLIEQAKEQIQLAFRLATLQARGKEVDRLSNLDYGMKKISTKELIVVTADAVEHKKGARSSKLIRIMLSDASARMPLYLSLQRGRGIEVGDSLRLEDAYVEASPLGGEKSLFIARKGKVIVIK